VQAGRDWKQGRSEDLPPISVFSRRAITDAILESFTVTPIVFRRVETFGLGYCGTAPRDGGVQRLSQGLPC